MRIEKNHKLTVLFVIVGLLASSYTTIPNSNSETISQMTSNIVLNNNDSLQQISIQLNLQKDLWHNEYSIGDIKVNKLGDIYISGTFDTDNFGFGDVQGFLSKLSRDGVVEWTQIINGTDSVGYFNRIAFDSNDNIIISGQAFSEDLSSSASLQDFAHGGGDNYYRKFSPSGEILWDSYLGGLEFECCGNVAVDSYDNNYLGGITWSFNFLTKNSIGNDFFGGRSDSFVTKVDRDGNLIWSSLFGGSGHDYLQWMDLISDEVLSIGIWTFSDNLPTVNAVQSVGKGGGDAYISLINTTSGNLIWATYLGGEQTDAPGLIKGDKSGNIYVIGYTDSENFTLINPMDSSYSGIRDGFISKFDSSGNLLWSSFLGGSNDEFMYSLIIDENDNPIIYGITYSDDFPVTDNSILKGGSDVFVTRVSSDGTSIISSTLIGGSDEEWGFGAFYNSENELLLGGYTFSDEIFYGNNNSISPLYPNNFGGEANGFLISYNLNTQNVNWATYVPAIPEPYLDYDQDGLTNQQEYELCFETTPRCTDPINPDTDGDGMFDGYEVTNSLNPLLANDFDSDIDKDGLTALQEFQLGTNPNSNDTDSDLMLDFWEVSMGLNPTLNDSFVDSDNDVMTNLYEYQNEFNASDFNDGVLDADNDGASNTEEFLAGTDPRVSDTDGDGMSDGFELEYNLDPLSNDASKDADGDHIPNGIESRLGFNPRSKIELYVFLGSVTVFTVLLYGFRRRKKIREKEAVKGGWESYKQKKQVLRDGFTDVEEYKDVVSKGFVNKRVMDLVTAQGFKSVDEMTSSWNTFTAQLTLFIGDKQDQELISMINSATSPKQLLIVENNTKQSVKSSESYQQDLNSMITLQSKIMDLFSQEKGQLFTEITENEIAEFSKRLFSLSEGLETKMKKLDQALTNKKEWFAPWQPLLTLIQITGDGTPISLEKIVEVTNTSQNQAEELLLALLSENPEIGTYNTQEKMYTKGTDVSKYLEEAMKMSKMLDEDIL